MHVRLVIFALAALFVQSALAATDVEFIVDVSGSMQQKLGGETQIESARKALMSSLEELQPGQLAALRVYGHRVEQTKKDESCKDTELLIPFKQVNRSEFQSKVAALTPKGYTPIAYSLEQSRNDLLDVGMGRETERVIILMTDGEETCGGDPIAVLKQLQAEGFKLKVFTVGFNVNDIGRKQLQEIASFTGGKYFDAANGAQLSTALKSAAKESAVLENKQKATYGKEVRGGDSYESAVPLEIGTELRLDHHQKKDDFDYFSLDVKRGEEVTLALSTLEKGIDIKPDGTAVTDDHPYAGLQVHDATRSKLKNIDIIGDPSKRSTITFRPRADGKYYVLLGSTYSSMNKDQVIFQATKQKRGDLGTDQDAGDSFETALPVQAQRYEKNSLGDTDEADWFSLDAKKGEKYVLGIIPNSKESSSFRVRLVDEFKQNLFDRSSTSNSGLKSEEIEIPDDGKYFIDVDYSDAATVEYTLVIKKKDSVVTETGGTSSGGNSTQ